MPKVIVSINSGIFRRLIHIGLIYFNYNLFTTNYKRFWYFSYQTVSIFPCLRLFIRIFGVGISF